MKNKLLTSIALVSLGFVFLSLKKIDNLNQSVESNQLQTLAAPNKPYTEAACVTNDGKAGVLCYSTTGRCIKYKGCTAIAGQNPPSIPTMAEINQMADNYADLMVSEGYIDLEDKPYSRQIAYNSLVNLYYP